MHGVIIRLGRGVRSIAFFTCSSILIAGCSSNEDLTRAIDGGTGRVVTSGAVPRTEIAWTDVVDARPGNDTLVGRPTSACWSGDRLVIADAAKQRIVVFDSSWRLLHLVSGPDNRSNFTDIAVVRCSSSRILVADLGLERVSFIDDAGRVMGTIDAPPTPQIHMLGDFAVTDSGRWYDSWLGAGIPIGPYLSVAEWDSVSLVRAWTTEGRPVNRFGLLVPYRNVVARRVLNRTFLLINRDTLWVLTQGDATVRAYTLDGSDTGLRMQLPIYYRGREPSITIDDPLDSVTDFRVNKFAYDPNVAGLAAVGDTLFATIRYTDWGYTRVGAGITVNRWPTSTVEIVSREGHVLKSINVKGFASGLTTDGRNRIAVGARYRDLSQHVLVGHLRAH